ERPGGLDPPAALDHLRLPAPDVRLLRLVLPPVSVRTGAPKGEKVRRRIRERRRRRSGAGSACEPVVVPTAVDTAPELRMRALPLPAARAVRPRGMRAPSRMGVGSGIPGEDVEGSSAPGEDRCVAVEPGSAFREPVLDPRAVAADARLHVEA